MSHETKLGRKYKDFLDEIANLTIGKGYENINIWDRLDKAIQTILYGDISEKSIEFFKACDNVMIDAGIDEEWVKAEYDNIDELLYGKLGPTP